eukprot:scaffold117869_cov63-Phaeocystis_antarctica.AAC.7
MVKRTTGERYTQSDRQVHDTWYMVHGTWYRANRWRHHSRVIVSGLAANEMTVLPLRCPCPVVSLWSARAAGTS